MAKAKKKAAKKAAKKSAKPAARKAVKKTIAKRKAAVAPRGKSIKRAVKKKPTSRRASRARQGVELGVSLELDNRLRDLAVQMDKSIEEIAIQALTEFADTWEDHLKTVKSLNAGDDRMQLAVRMDDDHTD